MKNKVFISFFIFILFLSVTISALFIYPERVQNFIIESFSLKIFLNKKIKKLVESKISDENIDINIQEINFLKPDWPDIVKIKLNNISFHSLRYDRKSNIDFIELVFLYNNLLKNIFLNVSEMQFSYIKINDLTLNAIIEKNKFLPGPLVKIFSSINQNNFQGNSSFKVVTK